MSSPSPNISSVNFDTPNIIVVCTDRYVILNKIPEFTLLAHCTGMKFLHAVTFNDLIVAVGDGDIPPYTAFFLQIFQKDTGVFIRKLEFPDRILDLKVNSSHLFVSLESMIQVYEITTFHSIATIDRKSASGLFTVNENIIAYPDDRKPGSVLIADIPGFSVVNTIQCHSGAIHNLYLSKTSNTLATASTKGTLIRLFDSKTGEKVGQYRRGYTQGDIIAMSLTPDYLCACSHQTLHVFGKDGRYVNQSLSDPPLACLISGNRITVALKNGTSYDYMINPTNFKIENVSQYRLVPPIALSAKHNRRITL